MALRDMLVSFGVEVTGKRDLDEVDTSLGQVIERANLLVKALAGIAIVKSVTAFVTDVVEMGAKVTDTANRLGVGTDELQEFEYGAKLVGVSAETAARSLAFLERNIGNAEQGNKRAAKTFQQLGLHIQDASGKTRPLGEILPDIAEKFQNIGDQEKQAAFATQLFGRAGMAMIPVLREGRAGLIRIHEEWVRLGGGLHGDFLSAAKEADRGLTRLGISVDMMKSRIVLGLLPGLDWLVDGLIKVTGYLGGLADRTHGAQTVLIALGVVALAVFAPMLLAIAPIVLAVGALYLAFDELFTLFEGDETLIGDFIDNLFGEGTAQEWVGEIKEAFTDLVDTLKTDVLPWLIVIKDILKDMWAGAKTPLHGFILLVKDLIQDLWRLTMASIKLSHGDFSGAYDSFSQVGNHFDEGDTSPKARDQKRADDAVAKLFPDRANKSVFAPSPIDPSWYPAKQLPEQKVSGHLPGHKHSAPGTLVLPDVTIVNHIYGAHDAHAAGQAVSDKVPEAVQTSLRDAHAAVSGWFGNPAPAATP